MAPSIITSNGTTRALDSTNNDLSGPSSGYQAFDHVLWYVGNAKQAASYYITRMGFRHIAYVGYPSESSFLLTC
jgi:4-hydroxyphenylpyruvate dioxygenase